jgi:hypothetical protein
VGEGGGIMAPTIVERRNARGEREGGGTGE